MGGYAQNTNVEIENQMPRLNIPFFFGKVGNQNRLIKRSEVWTHPEPWGSWASGNQASRALPLPPKGAQSLTLTARAFLTPKHPTQAVEVMVNGQKQSEVVFQQESNNQITIPITRENVQAGYLNIQFRFKNPARPKDLGIGDDDRSLSIGLESGVFR